jgi:hypothetical protein
MDLPRSVGTHGIRDFTFEYSYYSGGTIPTKFFAEALGLDYGRAVRTKELGISNNDCDVPFLVIADILEDSMADG